MKCFWFLFHDWTDWGDPVQTTWSNMHGMKGVGHLQTRGCKKCKRVTWRWCKRSWF